MPKQDRSPEDAIREVEERLADLDATIAEAVLSGADASQLRRARRLLEDLLARLRQKAANLDAGAA
jgi:hypothetical protein